MLPAAPSGSGRIPHCAVLRGVKLTRTLVPRNQLPYLIPAITIWATSTINNKIRLALLSEPKAAAVGMGNW